MTQNNNKKPWEQTFDDGTDSNGHLSRTKLRKQNHHNSLITMILVTAIILIAIVSLIFGLTRGSSSNSGKGESNNTQIIDKSSESASGNSNKEETSATSKKNSTHKESTTKAKSTKPLNETASNQSSEAKAASSISSSSPAKTEDSSVQQENSSKNNSSDNDVHNDSHHGMQNNDQAYTTVGAGQGVYRVAQNAGISMSELMELNGLSANSALHPGEKLRIK